MGKVTFRNKNNKKKSFIFWPCELGGEKPKDTEDALLTSQQLYP